MRTWFLIAVLCLGSTLTTEARALPVDEPVLQQGEKAGPGDVVNDEGLASSRQTESPLLPYRRPRFPIALNIRYGLPLTSQNDNVNRRWEHNVWQSYLGAFGAYWESPRVIFGDWWFIAGPEFVYEHNEEDMTSGAGSASLLSNFYGFQIDGGVAWQPKFLDRKAGVQFVLGLPIWGQIWTNLDSPGFSYDLGQRSVQVLDFQLNFFYDFDHHWKPFLGYQYRTSSNIALGLNYAF